MTSPVEHMRRFAGARLCADPVIAWARARGHCVPLSRNEVFRLWREAGAAEGAEIVARRAGLQEVREPRVGDAALVDAGEPALGLVASLEGHGGPLVTLLEATTRRVLLGRYPVIAAWRIGAP